jgi:hypothetical protein
MAAGGYPDAGALKLAVKAHAHKYRESKRLSNAALPRGRVQMYTLFASDVMGT